ncbi:MAG: DUF2380 domain-containing protein, partial [SAR324 cluster bacterium]|nr:DUF2380 domain-containing protein [SAR324 cluster bacterium]
MDAHFGTPQSARTWPAWLGFAAAAALLVLLTAAAASPAAAQDEEERERIAVLDLEPVGASEVETSALSDRLREELLKTGKYTLVDRNQLEAILDEQILQQATCTSAECALEVGRILGVRKIVTGRLSKIGDRTWQVSVQMLDVDTARTVRAESVIHEGRFVELIQRGMPELAAKLAGEEPAEPPPPPIVAQVEQEPVVAEEAPPPPPAEDKVRLWAGPSGFSMTITLEDSDTGETVTVEFGGGGIGLGVDFIIQQEFALWVAMHFGSIDSISTDNSFFSADAEDVEGEYAVVAGGVSAVIDLAPSKIMLGGGIFNAAVDFRGTFFGVPIDSDVSLTGILFDGRWD